MARSVLTGNSILATNQWLRSENRINCLLAVQTPPARKALTIPDSQPAYTDVIEVQAHKTASADTRVIQKIDESSLNNESQ